MKLRVLTAILIPLAAAALYYATPNFDHLPPSIRPHRPLPILAINAIGGLFARLGVLRLPDVDAILESACTAAALPENAPCVFDEPDDSHPVWRDGLRALLASYAADARLTALGTFIARGQAEQWLKTRARLLHAYAALPPGALAAEAIAAPLIIVGMPRTGTTFLHNLLKQDPALRAPMQWELVEPLPAAGATLGAAHVAALQAQLDQYTQLLPGIEEIHPMEATMAEEDVVTFSHEFSSILFWAAYNVSSYAAWVLQRPDHAHAMRWHRKLLQFLQRRARLDVERHVRERNLRAQDAVAPPPPPRWVLKTPWYLAILDDLVAEYPDALVVHTHRAPAAAIASGASVHAKTYGAASDHIDLRALGADQAAYYEEYVRRGLASRRRWKRDGGGRHRAADVQLAELKRDPIGAVRRVYADLGLALSDDAERAMRRWLETRQVRHGGHRWSLGDFGLSADEVHARPVFREYCEEFGVEGCGGG